MSHLSSPDALNIYQQHLGYNTAKNQLKWSGLGDVLSNFIRFILDEIDECSITTAEDHTHNLISYKAKDVIVKWYTATKTLLIQGAGHASFREKMLRVVNLKPQIELQDNVNSNMAVANGEASPSSSIPFATSYGKDTFPSSVSITTFEENVSPLHKCSCDSVLNKLSSMKNSIAELSKRVAQFSNLDPSLSSSTDQGREDPSYSISDLKEEIISLKSELRDQTKANKLLEMERDSLLTALRLLQEDQLKATHLMSKVKLMPARCRHLLRIFLLRIFLGSKFLLIPRRTKRRSRRLPRLQLLETSPKIIRLNRSLKNQSLFLEIR